MKNIKVIYRLIIGFTAIIFLLAVGVALTLLQVNTIRDSTDRIVNLRTPTARASSNMTSNIYASLASLRGWMLTGNPKFKAERTRIWTKITKTRTEMDAISEKWTNPGNIKKWNEFKVILNKFSAAQKQVEAIVHTADERPATKILVTEAAPRAAAMEQNISKLISLELSGNGGKKGDRIQILGIMANTRGSLSMGLANIRAYLLTANQKFADYFAIMWAKNEKYFGKLSSSASMLSPEQKTVFDEFKTNRAKFAPLPPKMFKIRASEEWNMANYRLVTEAIPRADKLLAILLGDVQEDGSRTGGMADNQQTLLYNDARESVDEAKKLFIMQSVLLFIGVMLGLLIAFLTARSIATPVVGMTSVMKRLADGEFDVEIPAKNRRDEIGKMAKAVQVFKENAIKRSILEKKQKELFRELDFQKFALDEHAIVSISDVQGNITYANKKFCEISKYSLDELIGQNHRILKSDEHSPEFFADMWKTISRGRVWQGEIKNSKKNGGEYWVMSTIVPSLNDKGKPFQYVSIRTDISERKKSEIMAMTASRTKSEIMANMSHELRTPLNAIIGFSASIKEQTFGPINNDKYREYLDDIHYSGQHLLELINDILDVSAIETGALKLYKEEISVSSVVDASIRLIMPHADNGHVTVTSSVGPEIPQIYVDKRRLKQVLLNLLSNAVKFTRKGGEVSVSSWLNGNGSLAIAVSDTGIGMDEKEAIKAMSMFGQVDSGLDRKHEGTGLGLPLTKGLMDMHNGTLEIKSKKNHGTLITVTFPRECVDQNVS